MYLPLLKYFLFLPPTQNQEPQEQQTTTNTLTENTHTYSTRNAKIVK